MKIFDKLMYEFGWVKRDRLFQASGALSDINVLCTSVPRNIKTDICDPKFSPEQMAKTFIICQETFAAILRRILCSADRERFPPSWYNHKWEEEIWADYLSGKLKACGHNTPTRKMAKDLDCEYSPSEGMLPGE